MKQKYTETERKWLEEQRLLAVYTQRHGDMVWKCGLCGHESKTAPLHLQHAKFECRVALEKRVRLHHAMQARVWTMTETLPWYKKAPLYVALLWRFSWLRFKHWATRTRAS